MELVVEAVQATRTVAMKAAEFRNAFVHLDTLWIWA